jgi:hypothetical protein
MVMFGTRIPIAADDHMEAAVVSPRTLAPLLTMMPAPGKPMPVSRLAITCVLPTAPRTS